MRARAWIRITPRAGDPLPNCAPKSPTALARDYIMVIDDSEIDSQWVAAKLRIVFGREGRIERSHGLGGSLVKIERSPPAAIFLDDFLPPRETALSTMPLIRQVGYKGPIVVFSGLMTPRRAQALMAAGACDAIAKDELDSERLLLALGRAQS